MCQDSLATWSPTQHQINREHRAWPIHTLAAAVNTVNATWAYRWTYAPWSVEVWSWSTERTNLANARNDLTESTDRQKALNTHCWQYLTGTSQCLQYWLASTAVSAGLGMVSTVQFLFPASWMSSRTFLIGSPSSFGWWNAWASVVYVIKCAM